MKTIAIVIAGIILGLLQHSFMPTLGIIASLDLVVIVVAFHLTRQAPGEGLLMALTAGLTQDLFSSLPFGIITAGLLTGSVAAHVLWSKVSARPTLLSAVGVAGIVKFIATLLVLAGGLAGGVTATALGGLLLSAAWGLIATVAAAALFYVPLRRFYRFLEFWRPQVAVGRRE